MRTLKKTLCLVLCLAMMVGLCAIGASAAHYDDYPDKEVIKYEEAVQLLTELGVLEGDEGGFRPNDTLTRDEAAALIVRLQGLTKEDVAKYTSTFTDVDDWAQPYVGYLQEIKVVEGVGGDKFNPKGTLTFVDFCAMLLRTLGYDKDRELMTGKTYEIGVLKLVNTLNLADGIWGYTYSAPVTREEAAKLAFNALLLNMVDYRGRLFENAVIDEDGNLQAGRRDNIPNNEYGFLSDGTFWDHENATEQMIERFWPNVKLIDGVDGFSIPVHTWFMGNHQKDYAYTADKEICEIELIGVMAEYIENADTVTMAEIYADSGWNGGGNLPVIRNGGLIGAIPLSKTRTTALDCGGMACYLIDQDGDGMADYLVEKAPYLAQVIEVIPADENAAGLRFVDILVFDQGGKEGTVYRTVNYSFNRRDFVLAYPAWTDREAVFDAHGDIDHYIEAGQSLVLVPGAGLQEVEVKTDKLAAAGRAKGKVINLKLADTTYKVGCDLLAKMGMGVNTVYNSVYAMNKSATLYLANGFVIGAIGEAPVYDYYVYLTNTYYTIEKDTSTWIETTPAMIRTNIIGYINMKGVTGKAVVSQDSFDSFEQGWKCPASDYGLTKFLAPGADFENDANTDPVKSVDVKVDAGTKLRFDKAIWDDDYKLTCDAKTEFVFFEKTLNARGDVIYTYKHYTGLVNLPTYELGEDVTLQAITVNGIAIAVYADLRQADKEEAVADTIYITNTAPNGYYWDAGAAATVYTYTGVVNGEYTEDIKTLLPVLPETVEKGMVVTPTYKDGFIIAVADAGMEYDYGTVEISNNTLRVMAADGKTQRTAFVVNNKTVAWYINDQNTLIKVKPLTVDDIIGRTGIITFTPVSAGDYTAAAVYVYVPAADPLA